MHALPGRAKQRGAGTSDKPCFYDVLGVDRDADDDEIRRAYKKLALFWHPDKNLDKKEEAAEIFQMVAEAYRILSDPLERRKYDRDGHPAVGRRASGSKTRPAPASAPPRRAPPAPAPAPAPRPAPVPARAPEPAAVPPQNAPHAQQTPYGWNASTGGEWPGVQANGGYNPSWPPQAFPFQQMPHHFPQHQAPQHFPHQNAFQPQAGPFPQQGPFPYGPAYPQQPFPQPAPPFQAQATPSYGPYCGGFTGGHAPAAASAPSTSTALSLPGASCPPPGPPPHVYASGPFGFQGGFPQMAAASPALVHRSSSPASTEASTDSEDESDDDEDETPTAVALPVAAPAPAPAPAPASRPRSLLMRRRHSAPDYPKEERLVPPVAVNLNPSYPKETRVANHASARDVREAPEVRPATLGRGGSRRMKISLDVSAALPSASPSNSSRPSVSRGADLGVSGFAGVEDEFGGGGGLVRKMDRMFTNILGGSFGAGVTLTAEEMEGAANRRATSVPRMSSFHGDDAYDGDTRSFSKRLGGTWKAGAIGRMSSRSSKTTRVGLDGVRRTVFSRTESTIIRPDGTRSTAFEEFMEGAQRSGGQASGSGPSHVGHARSRA